MRNPVSKTNIFTFIFYAVLIVAALVLTSCSSGIEVMSSHNGSPIQINGERSDWAGNLVQSDDKKVAFGFRNDQEFLYLLVTTGDRATAMKMLLQGMTVRIKSDNGEELGIRYPMKPLPEDIREIRGIGNKDEQPGLEKFVHELKKVNDQIQVVTKDDYPVYTSGATQGKSLKGSFGMSDGLFVVEMQIPLTGDEIAGRLFPQYPQNILINFTTGKPDFQGFRPEGGAGKEGGNGGMSRGGRRGNRGGERPGGGGDRPDFKPVDQSFRVKIVK